MQLNEKQQMAIDKASKGKNLFITGSGGVGKSVIVNKLSNHFSKSAILLAPTGIAALNIGGSTLHRTFSLPFSICHTVDWAPFGNAVDLFEDDTIQTIIIDEISMVRADVFVAIDQKLRRIKGYLDIPFGGIQVIVVGDFFQLPPILTYDEYDAYFELFESIYCFNTNTWHDLELEVINLEHVIRQGDENTVRALNAIRHGNPPHPVLKWLNKQCGETEVSEDAVTLCTRNSDAQEINTMFYDEINSPEKTFYAKIEGHFNEQPVEKVLKLKIGCRVLLCANNGTIGYHNGQSGYVADFVYGDESYIIVELDCGPVVKVEPYVWESISHKVTNKQLIKSVNGSFKQFPIKLGYGITIHKSQSMTLDECILDLGSGAFSHGQTYVGLSRIRSLDTMLLERPINANDIIVDQDVINFYQMLEMND